MYDQPYLETCCRSALHRLVLAGEVGRPGGMKDGPCLVRLCEEGFAQAREDGRFVVSEAGRVRHGQEIAARA
jgi:hypothetical protein